MTKKDMQQELYNYNFYKTKLKQEQLTLKSLENEYEGIKGIGFDSTGGGGTNKINRSVENEVLIKDNKITQVKQAIEEYTLLIDKLLNSLEVLNALERDIIEERYFKNNDWFMVAENVGYSIAWVKRVNSESLEKLIAVYE